MVVSRRRILEKLCVIGFVERVRALSPGDRSEYRCAAAAGSCEQAFQQERNVERAGPGDSWRAKRQLVRHERESDRVPGARRRQIVGARGSSVEFSKRRTCLGKIREGRIAGCVGQIADADISAIVRAGDAEVDIMIAAMVRLTGRRYAPEIGPYTCSQSERSGVCRL